MAPIEQTITVSTHGRYLVESAGTGQPMLAGFHGYAESAEIQLARMRGVSGADRWTVVSLQGLHGFYLRRTNDVVASWMTRQNRELAMADNRVYVASAIAAEWSARRCAHGVVMAGFSQGVAMAFRAVSAVHQPILGVVAVGGDVPPELVDGDLSAIGHALIMRGVRDPVYAPETFARDQQRLRDAGVRVTAIEFDGGHEWPQPVFDAASRFLKERRA